MYLKADLKAIEQEEIYIPAWHMNIVREGLEDYKSNPEQAMDFDPALDDIGKDL